MRSNELGKDTVSKLLQSLKAPFPISVTPSGITILFSVVPSKAPPPIVVTVFGIFVLLNPIFKVFVAVSITALQLSLLSYVELPSSTTIDSKLVQPLNTVFSILCTSAGMVMDLRLTQLRNALPLISQTGLLSLG